MRLERVEDQLIERFLQRERVVLGGGFHEILHVEKRAADLLMQFLQDGGFAAARAAGQPQNRTNVQRGGQMVVSPRLRRAKAQVDWSGGVRGRSPYRVSFRSWHNVSSRSYQWIVIGQSESRNEFDSGIPASQRRRAAPAVVCGITGPPKNALLCHWRLS